MRYEKIFRPLTIITIAFGLSAVGCAAIAPTDGPIPIVTPSPTVLPVLPSLVRSPTPPATLRSPGILDEPVIVEIPTPDRPTEEQLDLLTELRPSFKEDIDWYCKITRCDKNRLLALFFNTVFLDKDNKSKSSSRLFPSTKENRPIFFQTSGQLSLDAFYLDLIISDIKSIAVFPSPENNEPASPYNAFAGPNTPIYATGWSLIRNQKPETFADIGFSYAIARILAEMKTTNIYDSKVVAERIIAQAKRKTHFNMADQKDADLLMAAFFANKLLAANINPLNAVESRRHARHSLERLILPIAGFNDPDRVFKILNYLGEQLGSELTNIKSLDEAEKIFIEGMGLKISLSESFGVNQVATLSFNKF